MELAIQGVSNAVREFEKALLEDRGLKEMMESIAAELGILA